MIKFLINRPIAVIMSFMVVVLLGLIAFHEIPITLLPETDVPKIEVIINNPGNSPEDFDNQIVEKFRNNLLQVGNVVDVNSYSDISQANIELFFNYETKIDLAFFEINEKIDEVLSDLELPIERPKVIKLNLSDIPSLYLSVSLESGSPRSFIELSSFVNDRFKNKLEQCAEIAFVDVAGLAQNTVKIDINENYIDALNISLIDIKKAFDDNNFSLGKINISEGNFTFDLALENTIETLNDIENTTLKIGDKLILLSEIAKVYNEVQMEDEYYNNLEKSISLAIVKSPKYSESDFILRLEDVLDEFHVQYPDIAVSITKDQTKILKETLKSLNSSLFFGILLAITITFFFLNSIKNVILIVLTITVSLIMNFLLFFLLDVSINLISISGLILGIGLMIDNIIIVLDNIEQKINSLQDLKGGSISGVNEITSPLISSALTTCSIFIPLIFLSGLAGALFYDQAISVTIALFSSFCTSIIFLPTVYVLFHNKFKQRRTSSKLEPIYKRVFIKVDNNKSTLYLVTFIILVSGAISFMLIDKRLLPDLRSKDLVFKIDWGKNLINQELIARSNRMIKFLDQDISASEFYINQQSFLSNTQRNIVREYETYYILQLKNGDRKDIVKNKILSNLKESFYDANVLFLSEENALNTIISTGEYNLKVISYDEEISSEIIQNELEKEDMNLVFNSIGESRGVELKIIDDRIFAYELDKNSIIEFIKLKLGEEKLMSINYGSTFIPVTYFNNNQDLDYLLNSRYISKNDDNYRLGDLVTLKYITYKKGVEAELGGISDILYVKAESPELVINSVKREFSKFNISFEGSYRRAIQLRTEMFYIICITILLLYLILSIQFESLKLPIIILLEIPIDVSISLILLYLTNQTMNVMSFVGIIVMCGIIINDSILKIDLINKLYRAGALIDDAIQEAGKRRLNAIVMTSLTTLLAIAPILFQDDISSQLQTPLIISLIGGLFIGTLVSIFIIPIIYKKLV